MRARRAFATPRRLALHIVGLPEAQPIGARSARGRASARRRARSRASSRAPGLARIEDAKIESDAKKGEFYVAVIEKPGRATRELIAEIVPAIIRALSLAEIDALGRGLGAARRAALGAPAALDPVHVRRPA